MTASQPVPPAGPTAAQVLAHVHASAALLGLPLDEARAQAVAGHLLRSAGLAALLEAVPMPPDLEPAEVWCPAPFPGEDPA
ncbi:MULTISPECIES: DUF4089 domain-containing protein [Ramlibacter]|uniref:DUF4089 domain-containing protein n=1 Tax=Ramlibacter TaxID=174951 RepID=UPI002579A27A|nr:MULTISPECIES: DUF4089 domain-containing protein [Ramlibacter]